MYLMAAQGNNYCKINLKRAEASTFNDYHSEHKHPSVFIGRENSRILPNCGKQFFSFKVLSETK